jgi:hypothetical protein
LFREAVHRVEPVGGAAHNLVKDLLDHDLGSGGQYCCRIRALRITSGSWRRKGGNDLPVDCDNMGQFNAATSQIVQTLPRVMGGIWRTACGTI